MIQIFLSRSREANFHVSFSSRFSRLENNFSFFFRPISLSPLDFQDFWRKFLCLLSIFKIFLINILIIDHWAWYVKIWFYHFIIWPLSLSPNCPTGSWPHPDTVSDKDCRKGKFLPLWFFVFLKVWYICQFLFLFSKLGKGILDFSFSSRNWRKEFRFLFLLSKLGKKIWDFSFSSRDEAKEFGFLFLFSKLVKGNSDFSFSSRMWRNCF